VTLFPIRLLQKYHPKKLTDVLGQSAVVQSLKMFVKAPYSCAMLFWGESGVGKTCTAHALARDLGVAVDAEELGGLHEIASGEMTGEAVRSKMNALRLSTLWGSHWRVLIANEADRMTAGAETIFLDALEHLPSKVVVVFTTNEPERLSKRLRDRCEVYGFVSDPDQLAPALQAFAKRVWRGEGRKGAPPDLKTLGMPTLGSLDTMHASFRLAAQQIARHLREAVHGNGNHRRVQNQLAKDLLITRQAFEVTCDACGHTQDLAKGGADSFQCRKCNHTNLLEWEQAS